MSPFEPFLSANGFVALDGGLATELEAKGAKLTDHLWSASLLDDNPSLILETHLAFYRAGADTATTASYQASFEGFLRKGIDRAKATELLLLSVDLAVQARDQFWRENQRELVEQVEYSAPNQEEADSKQTVVDGHHNRSVLPAIESKSRADKPNQHTAPPTTTVRQHDDVVTRNIMLKEKKLLRPLVAASLGSFGAALADGSEYGGDYAKTVGMVGLREWHRERLDVFAGADGLDLVMFETIPCLEEVQAILSLLQDYGRRISAVISISCQDAEHLCSGELVRDFANLIWPLPADRTATQSPTSASRTGATAVQQKETASTVSTELPSTPSPLVGVGVNCTAPEHVAGVLKILAGAKAANNNGKICEKLGEIALVAYPNSGEEWDATARDWVAKTGLRGDAGVIKFGRMAKEWYGAGATVIGGCCRTIPAHITSMNAFLTTSHEEPVPVVEAEGILS